MAEEGRATTLFNRSRRNNEAPPDDPERAPYGWMRDKTTGQWRPKKSPGRPKGSTAPRSRKNAPRSKRPRKRATSARGPAQLTAVHDDEEAQQIEPNPNPDHDPPASWQEQPGQEAEEPPDQSSGKASLQQDVRALVAMVYTIPGDILPNIDPYCFGPLADPKTTVTVIDSVTEIVMGSPKVAAWVASASGLMPWIKLGLAVKPVVANGWRHHVKQSVQVDIDRQAMTYEVRERDYSEYPAA
jgi:hypothetical protein